jgi:chromosome segregation ATPase
MDTTIAILLKNIKQKVQKLTVDNTVLHKQNATLLEKIEKQNSNNLALTTQVQQLQTQLKALQLIQTDLPIDEKRELTKSIDKHIATLQKTITLLSE